MLLLNNPDLLATVVTVQVRSTHHGGPFRGRGIEDRGPPDAERERPRRGNVRVENDRELKLSDVLLRAMSCVAPPPVTMGAAPECAFAVAHPSIPLPLLRVAVPRLELGTPCSQSKRLRVSSSAWAFLNSRGQLALPSVPTAGTCFKRQARVQKQLERRRLDHAAAVDQHPCAAQLGAVEIEDTERRTRCVRELLEGQAPGAVDVVVVPSLRTGGSEPVTSQVYASSG